MKLGAFFLYLLLIPSFISASTELEDFLKNKEYRDHEISYFKHQVHKGIPSYFSFQGEAKEIEGTPCTERDIIFGDSYYFNPGNLLLDRLIYDWCLFYDSLPYPQKISVPVCIVLTLEKHNSHFFSYDEEEKEWMFFSCEEAIEIVSDMLTDKHNIIFNNFAAPAA